MGLFNRRKQRDDAGGAVADGAVPGAAMVADLPKTGDFLPQSLTAHSGFIKRAKCRRCGAPKKLPSKTAYLYCDYCGALVDYDFRIANADTNAGITNTVFHRLIAPVAGAMEQAKAAGDRDAYRELQRGVFSQWVQLCPQAVSPRAKTDEAFRDRLVAYLAETAVTKDLDPAQAPLDAQMASLTGSLQRIPTAGGAWLVAGPFWPMAELFKQQMELAYALINSTGVSAMDPDDCPSGVALAMEYSTFCQGWLPHLSAEDGQRLLAAFGLTGEYVKLEPQPTDDYQCGGCGARLQAVQGAQAIVCEDCGTTLDIKTGPAPCRTCGAPLCFPVSASHLACPYCHSETQHI
ncbi:MAG: hypothetical protein WCP28_15105 [Actinomycetes bacterium]